MDLGLIHFRVHWILECFHPGIKRSGHDTRFWQ
jgi:hypothetical protein